VFVAVPFLDFDEASTRVGFLLLPPKLLKIVVVVV
jgi:hypothetical protein